MANLEYSIGQGYSALDAEAWRNHMDGFGVVSGLGVTVNTGLTLTVASGTATVGETSGTVDTATLGSNTDITLDAADSQNPRKDVVYLDTNGTLQNETGVAEAADPSGNVRFNTFQPEPPFPSTSGVILAEVWVGAGATTLSSADVRDRRVPADFVGDRFVGNVARFDDHNNTLWVSPSENGDGIQSAIDTLQSSGGGTVQLEPGSYDVSTTLVKKPDVRLSGAGRTATVLNSTITDGSAVIDLDSASGTTTTRQQEEISHLRIDGNGSEGDGILISYVTWYRIFDLIVTNVGGHGIAATNADNNGGWRGDIIGVDVGLGSNSGGVGGDGLHLDAANNDVTIERVGLYDSARGFYVAGGQGVSLRHMEIAGNTGVAGVLDDGGVNGLKVHLGESLYIEVNGTDKISVADSGTGNIIDQISAEPKSAVFPADGALTEANTGRVYKYDLGGPHVDALFFLGSDRVQQAIDAAEGATRNKTVYVPAGTYSESVTVSGDGVTLEGDGREETTIDGAASGVALSVTGKRVTVKDLSIQTTGGTLNAAEIGNVECTIENAYIPQATDDGVLAQAAGDRLRINGLTGAAGSITNALVDASAATDVVAIIPNDDGHTLTGFGANNNRIV